MKAVAVHLYFFFSAAYAESLGFMGMWTDSPDQIVHQTLCSGLSDPDRGHHGTFAVRCHHENVNALACFEER